MTQFKPLNKRIARESVKQFPLKAPLKASFVANPLQILDAALKLKFRN
jgi:hypothetical protein